MNSFDCEIPIVRGEAPTFKPKEAKIKSSKSAYKVTLIHLSWGSKLQCFQQVPSIR
jgi:hypothetical protein